MNLIKNLNVTEINTALLSLMDYIKKIENATEKEEQKIESSSSSSSSDFSELTVPLVGGSGKYISAISETDGKINATATDLGNMVPVNSVTSGNMHSVTSNAVANYVGALYSISGSVHPTSVEHFEICRLTLPAGKYIIIGYSDFNKSINRNYNFRIISSGIDKTVRGNSTNGGGIINSCICQKSESFDVIAYGYGFTEYINDSEAKQRVTLQAIKIGN